MNVWSISTNTYIIATSQYLILFNPPSLFDNDFVYCVLWTFLFNCRLVWIHSALCWPFYRIVCGSFTRMNTELQDNDSVKSHIPFWVNVTLIRSNKNENRQTRASSQFIISHINSGWCLEMIIVLQLNDNLT